MCQYYISTRQAKGYKVTWCSRQEIDKWHWKRVQRGALRDCSRSASKFHEVSGQDFPTVAVMQAFSAGDPSTSAAFHVEAGRRTGCMISAIIANHGDGFSFVLICGDRRHEVKTVHFALG